MSKNKFWKVTEIVFEPEIVEREVADNTKISKSRETCWNLSKLRESWRYRGSLYVCNNIVKLSKQLSTPKSLEKYFWMQLIFNIERFKFSLMSDLFIRFKENYLVYTYFGSIDQNIFECLNRTWSSRGGE